VNESSFHNWLCESRMKIGERHRRGFDTVMILVAWTIWKKRNNRIFNQQQRSWTEVVKAMAEEAML
ncbi:Os09g0440000, partial [Oryza sativa Japonica Group]